ncbi:hypothetical protein F3Y22_tig00110989pilonHSYRG00047 [Hibiscus syriacus]|uniref:Uncharacterized protein n=1 Tax=Hibiscus syriacus TaxID=106335 RepID=A0A6A2Z9I0_HIBSY|nr:hypothetical protein F3Y22_tig00110989pilonHSYRG00047 [Hibiscus syriacus]
METTSLFNSCSLASSLPLSRPFSGKSTTCRKPFQNCGVETRFTQSQLRWPAGREHDRVETADSRDEDARTITSAEALDGVGEGVQEGELRRRCL